MGIPYIKGSPTSHAAALSIAPHAPPLRLQILKLITNAADGLTDDEIEVITGLRHQTASARRRELVLSGHVVNSGARRRTTSGRTATVWIATPEQLDLWGSVGRGRGTP